MFQKFGIEDIIKSKAAIGVEIILLSDGAYEINVVALKRNKSDVLTEIKESGIKDIASLSKIFDHKTPIVLVINGKGIIHRKVTVSETDSISSVLNKVLPNANLNEFYIQKHGFGSSQTYVSIVRASVINDILNALKEDNIANIVDCFIGPFLINNVLSLIDTSVICNEFLIVGNNKLLIREGEIFDVQSSDAISEDKIKIGDELLDGKLVLPFAAALSYFVGGEQGLLNSEIIDSVKDDFKQKQKFQFFGWSLLISTFAILLANYLVFDHYWKKSTEMNSTLELNQSALKKCESLKAEYAQKKDFLEQNGLLESSRTSYFADQLASSVPMSIQLLEMDIHPVKKNDVNDISNALYFDTKTIKISGKCNRNTELNDWMKELKSNIWIEKVSLLNYKQDNAKEDGVFFMELKLK